METQLMRYDMVIIFLKRKAVLIVIQISSKASCLFSWEDEREV